MRKLEIMDLQWALRLAPNPLLKILKDFPGEVFIAGGFLRSTISNEKISDIDVFTPTKEKAKAYALLLADGNKDKIYETDNAITVKGFMVPIQFITRWTFSTPESCIQSFDFTISCAAFWWQNNENSDGHWESICEDNFYSDLAGKRIVYRKPIRNEDAGGSMLRVLKYYQKGFRIPLDSLGHVIARLVSAIDKENINIKDENAVGTVLSGLLREVDPSIDPSHIAHLPFIQSKEV